MLVPSELAAPTSMSPDSPATRDVAGVSTVITVGTNGSAPLATYTGPSTGAEGSALSFDASSSTDPTSGDPLTFSWTFGDGGTATGSVVTHTYADNGVYPVTVIVADAHGGSASYARNVSITNVNPSATFTFPRNVNEGPNFTMSLDNVVDPGTIDATQLTYSFDCGAGLGDFSSTASISCPAPDNGRLFVHGVVRDKDGAETTYDGRVIVFNVAPTATFNFPATPVRPGSSFTLSLTNIVEPSSVDVVTYEFDCGAGFVAAETPSVVCPGAASGTLEVHARIMDSDGDETIYDGSVSFGNVPPTATLVAPATVIEGSPIAFSLTSVTGAAPLTFSYACSATESLRASSSAAFSCSTTDNGSVTVRARVTDTDGTFVDYSQLVSVTNAAPVIASFTTPTAAAVGASVTASLTYSDVGSADTHSAVIAWGDGSTSTVNGTAGTAAGTHSYTSAGSYTISVLLSDDDGGTASRTASAVLVVTAPVTATGSVKADGWLPAYGAWARSQNYNTAHYGSSSRTTFTVDVKYDRGVPRGFAFGSTADHIVATARTFDYLNIKDNTATLRGTGTLSNGTAIGFLFYAVDDKNVRYSHDKVRIKIWNKATGRVLFDTEPGVSETASKGTVIAGGCVTVTK